MRNINWEVLVGAVGIILLVILGWWDLKSELDELRTEVSGMSSDFRNEVGGMRSELSGEVGGMRSELSGEVSSMRGELSGDVSSIRGDLRGIRSEVSGIRRDFRNEVGGMREDIRIIKSLLIAPGTEAIHTEAPGDAAETDAGADKVAPGGEVGSGSGDALPSSDAAGG